MPLRRVAILGLGRVGRALIHSFELTPDITLVGLSSRSTSSRMEARKLFPHLPHQESLEELLLTEADVLIVAVKDSAIADTIERIDGLPRSKSLRVVTHTSGSLGLTRMDPKAGLHEAMFHPLSATHGHTALPSKTIFGVTAHFSAIREELQELARTAGFIPWTIEPEHTGLYHAAATIASNLPVLLFADALRCLQSIGIAPDDASVGIVELMRSMVDNLVHQVSTKNALTGPIARVDTATLQTHVAALEALPDIASTYRNLSSRLGQEHHGAGTDAAVQIGAALKKVQSLDEEN